MGTIRPSSHPATNSKVFDLITAEGIFDKKVLDIGAGRGYMAQLLGDYLKQNGKEPAAVLSACDLFPEFFEYRDITCEKMAFSDLLPFQDESYDIIYAIEVLEHLHNPYSFIREAYRAVKPGGKVIISVPNVLNLSSRLSYLLHGFFDLFEPLSFKGEDAGRLCGHIMPLNYFYIEHGMRRAGFRHTSIAVDKIRKSTLFLYYLLYPLQRFSAWRFNRHIKAKNRYLYDVNREALENVNGKIVSCARSCILVGVK